MQTTTKHFEDTINAIPIPVIVVRVADQNTFWMNSICLKRLGYLLDDVLGEPISHFVLQPFDDLFPQIGEWASEQNTQAEATLIGSSMQRINGNMICRKNSIGDNDFFYSECSPPDSRYRCRAI